MNRIAIKLGIFNIYWYSIFILLAIVMALFVIYKECIKQNIPKEKIFDMAYSSIILGIIGARIYYVIFNLNYYLKNPIEIIEIWNGGLAIHGGILFGCLSIIYFCKKNKLNTLKMLDIIVVGVILGQAIGRWGNFFNQEAYGPITTYNYLKNSHIPTFIINGMKIGSNYYIPTFLYESIWNLLGFILLICIRKNKNLKIGTLSGIYLIWYSFGRFFIEGLRSDSLMLGPIKVAQLLSIILIILGIILISKNKKTNNLYHNKKGS